MMILRTCRFEQPLHTTNLHLQAPTMTHLKSMKKLATYSVVFVSDVHQSTPSIYKRFDMETQ